MKVSEKTVGSFEAKTHLSHLIEDVEKGNEYVITRRGKPVARLVPFKGHNADSGMDDILRQFDSIRNSVTGRVNIKEFIREGRKY